MPPQNAIPGVYTEEFYAPNQVIAVPTAVPAFIGYTEKAVVSGNTYFHQPIQIHSLDEYEKIFGKGEQATLRFSFTTASAGTAASALEPVISLGQNKMIVSRLSPAFRLYHSIRLFYLNGGADCYVIAVGDYNHPPSLVDLVKGLTLLEKEAAPTMLIIPDAVSLPATDHASLVRLSLAHCEKMQNRVVILDVYNGAVSESSQVERVISDFRNGTGDTGLCYGAAYFPWLITGIVHRAEINFNNLPADLADYLEKNDKVARALEPIATLRLAYRKDPDNAANNTLIKHAQAALLATSAYYVEIISAALSILNVLPPAAAMAGIYTLTDTNKSVSNAPANVILAAVLAPTINLTDLQQMGLNVDDTGKSVNAIRAFPMRGVLAWGAKTLDGNSRDWKYINVRRSVIMIEQSVKLAVNSFVFAPNNAQTWTGVKAVIEIFLTNFWKQGGLAGTKPDQAFMVAIGLGETMSAQDILNGYMRITVMVAISHPAEFIKITVEQLMPSS